MDVFINSVFKYGLFIILMTERKQATWRKYFQLEHDFQVSKLTKRYLCGVNESYDEVKNVDDSNVDFSRYPGLLSSLKSAA